MEQRRRLRGGRAQRDGGSACALEQQDPVHTNRQIEQLPHTRRIAKQNKGNLTRSEQKKLFLRLSSREESQLDEGLDAPLIQQAPDHILPTAEALFITHVRRALWQHRRLRQFCATFASNELYREHRRPKYEALEVYCHKHGLSTFGDIGGTTQMLRMLTDIGVRKGGIGNPQKQLVSLFAKQRVRIALIRLLFVGFLVRDAERSNGEGRKENDKDKAAVVSSNS